MVCMKELLAASTLNKVDAKVLMAHLIQKHLNWPKSALISKDTDTLPPALIAEWQSLEARRAMGEPIAYILGHKGFYNIELKVAPGVLIPRPETELLVELAMAHIQLQNISSPRILDLGTGSGAIALAIAKNIPKATVTAVDLSEQALAIAKENAHLLGLSEQIRFYQGNWFEALPQDIHHQFDVILSNPPYIPLGDQHLTEGDLRFEPDSALTDFHDGLSAYKAIIKVAKNYLSSHGLIALEHGYDQRSEEHTSELQSH